MSGYRPYVEKPIEADFSGLPRQQYPVGRREELTYDQAGLESESSGYDTDTSIESAISSEQGRRYAPQKLFDPPDRAELYRMGGPTFNKNTIVTGNSQYAQYTSPGVSKPIEYGKTDFKTAAQTRQTMVLVDSQDRDRQAYPQPTSLQLYLPRVYRNVTSVAIQQMKLLNSFLYFRQSKYNISFNIWEEGRYLPDGTPNIMTVRIREGSYNINTLLNELTVQMNTTPTFFHYPNDFNDFAALFPVSGDLGINFNLPGDYYYDSLLERHIQNPTFDYIITRYFTSRYVNQPTFTLDEIQNAYYYPVLKEAFLDGEEVLRLVLPLGENFQDIFQRVVFGFTGLSDTYTLAIIQANIAELDAFRDTMTFQYHLINNYNWSVIPYNNRVTVSSSNLNTSLVNLIAQQSNYFLSNALLVYNINFAQYQTLINNANRQNAILISMYNYLQQQLATSFAINFGAYSIDQLANASSYIYIQNGSNVSGVYTSYSVDYINAINNGTIKPIPDFNAVPTPAPIQWPNMNFPYSQPVIDLKFDGPLNLVNVTTNGFLNVYDFTLSNINPDIRFTDSNGIINANDKYGSADVVANISAGTYAIFAFRSPARQQLQVETLPRPYAYRYPAFNSNYGGNIQYYFNKDYEFNNLNEADNATGIQYQIVTDLPYGADRAQVSSTTSLASTISLNIISNYKFIDLFTPQPPVVTYGTDIAGFDYQLNIELSNATANAPFSTNVGVYVYHDRAAYMADAQNLGSEKPVNYLTSFNISATASSIVQPLTVLASNNYYFIIRPDSMSFDAFSFNFLAYWTNPTPRALLSTFTIEQPGVSVWSEQFGLAYANTPSNVNYYFYKTYNSNYIRLPIQTSLYGSNPSDQQFNFLYPSSAPTIGYDSNDVSNDLTDYVSFTQGLSTITPGTRFSFDPANEFIFDKLSPYVASTIQSYFYTGAQNQILTSTTLTPYNVVFNNNDVREYKIVHYWNPTFMGPHEFDAGGWSLAGLSTLQTMTPYTAATTGGVPVFGPDYTYSADPALGVNTLKIGKGIYGWTFLPSDGTWDVQKISFKSAYMGSNDPNDLIEYLAVFDTNSISYGSLGDIAMSNAFAVLQRAGKTVYTPDVVSTLGGYDPSYGTWYQYNLASNFIYGRPDLVAQGLPGYTPYPSTLVTGQENLYSVVAFNASYELTTIFMLCGSAVPFPTNTTATVSNNYLGFYPPNGEQLVVPTNQVGGSNYIRNIYQSQYEQSIPIGTSALMYSTELPVYQASNALQEYSPFGGFTGNPAFNLRTANYYEGSQHYVLFGDPTGSQTHLVDIYRLRNVGLPGRDSVYINTLDLTPYVGGEPIITWTANSYSLFVLTRPNPATQDIKIYEMSTITTAPTSGFHQGMRLIGTDYIGFGWEIIPSFSTNVCKMYFTDNKDWIYSDNASLSSIGAYFPPVLQPNLRGFIQYNNQPGLSTFTSLVYDQPGNNRFQMFDVTTSPDSTYSYNMFYDALVNIQTIRIFSFSNSAATMVQSDGTIFNRLYGTPNTLITEVRIPTAYSPNLSNIFVTQGDIYGISYTATNRFQYIQLTPSATPGESNSIVIASAATFVEPITATPTFGYATDANGGLWFSFQLGDIFTTKPIGIYGNSGILDDATFGFNNLAYQMFYPTSKIVLTKRSNKYNDITNLVDINYFGSNYFEYPKTEMFYYSNYDSLLSDILGTSSMTTVWKWGQESNYLRADNQFQGYGFYSYIYNIPLTPSEALTPPNTSTILVGLDGNINDYNFIAIRGYSPSEDFQCLVRFNLPNRYDYGIIQSPTLINEISTAKANPNLSNYNPEYISSILLFDQTFSTTKIYGSNALSNFSGSTITTSSFGQFYSIFSTLYSVYNSNAQIISGIQSNIDSNLQSYLSNYFGTIFPSTIYDNLRLTDAVPYDLLFASSIAPQLQSNITYWGLGYNLGFDRSNYVGTTVYVAPSFYKILDDYIYLQLNDDLSMNLLDTTGLEDFNTSLESTGQVRKYFGKLLLSGFGNYSQTMIGTTVTFNPPLGRLDKMKFNWVDINGNIIDNADCEWSACLAVNEQVNQATVESSLPRL